MYFSTAFWPSSQVPPAVGRADPVSLACRAAPRHICWSSSRGKQGQSAIAFLHSPGSCHVKENKKTVLVEPALPECIYPCLIFDVSPLPFSLNYYFRAFGLPIPGVWPQRPLLKAGSAVKRYSRGQQNLKRFGY